MPPELLEQAFGDKLVAFFVENDFFFFFVKFNCFIGENLEFIVLVCTSTTACICQETAGRSGLALTRLHYSTCA